MFAGVGLRYQLYINHTQPYTEKKEREKDLSLVVAVGVVRASTTIHFLAQQEALGVVRALTGRAILEVVATGPADLVVTLVALLTAT